MNPYLCPKCDRIGKPLHVKSLTGTVELHFRCPYCHHTWKIIKLGAPKSAAGLCSKTMRHARESQQFCAATNCLSLHSMSQKPLCPRCEGNLFVRAEQFISGGRVIEAYYCGRCNAEWEVHPERREADRRITVRPKSNRRTRSAGHAVALHDVRA